MEPTSNLQGAQRPHNLAGIHPQPYRGRSIPVSGATPRPTTMPSAAREITPVVEPMDDFEPVNPDAPAPAPAPKSGHKALGILLSIILIIAAFTGGVFVGMNWDKIFKKTETASTEPTAETRDLTETEISALSKKVDYLTMSRTVDSSLIAGDQLLFINLANNTLTDSDRLLVTITSLSDEYARTNAGCANTAEESTNCADSSATISAERVASRYYELFGKNLVYVESSRCPSYILSEDKATYIVKEGEACAVKISTSEETEKCGEETEKCVALTLSFTKDAYRYLNGYAYVDITDSSDRRFSLRFKADDVNNYYFVDTAKPEQTRPENSENAPAPTEDEKPADAPEPPAGEPEPTDAPVTPTDSAENSENTSSASDDTSDDISYETDPDAPPCPRSNPYARCVE